MKLLSYVFGEFIGTFVLVFITCMGATEGLMSHDLTIVQAALTTGLGVLVAMQLTIHISGAYINPVVALAAAIMNQIKWIALPLYFVSEIAGGVVGYAMVLALTPKWSIWSKDQNGTNYICGHCITCPNEFLSDSQALFVEATATAIMVLGVCASWDPRCKNSLDSIAIRIGLLVTVIVIAMGSYTGASMNPARSFGPAAIHLQFDKHWIYWVGPFLGGIVASVFYRLVLLQKTKPSEAKLNEPAP